MLDYYLLIVAFFVLFVKFLIFGEVVESLSELSVLSEAHSAILKLGEELNDNIFSQYF